MVHKAILKANAPMLFGICEKQDKDSTVCIADTRPKVFRAVLRYAYGGVIPRKPHTLGKELIEAANKYNVTGLKVAVELGIVQKQLMTVDNVSEWLIFAEAKTCPLLKEHATSYILARASDVMKSEHSKELKESPELMEHLFKSQINNDDCFSEYEKMSVSELRDKLIDYGEDIDGSKEMLIERLKFEEDFGDEEDYDYEEEDSDEEDSDEEA